MQRSEDVIYDDVVVCRTNIPVKGTMCLQVEVSTADLNHVTLNDSSRLAIVGFCNIIQLGRVKARYATERPI